DPQHRGEEQGGPDHPRGEAAGELGAVESVAEDDEGGDREEDHRRQRTHGSQFGAEILGDDCAEGLTEGGHGPAPPIASSRTWSATARARSGTWDTNTRVTGASDRQLSASGLPIRDRADSRPSGSRLESGSSSSSSDGRCSTARQIA